jgi:elongation factor 1 alpha-like protein
MSKLHLLAQKRKFQKLENESTQISDISLNSSSPAPSTSATGLSNLIEKRKLQLSNDSTTTSNNSNQKKIALSSLIAKKKALTSNPVHIDSNKISTDTPILSVIEKEEAPIKDVNKGKEADVNENVDLINFAKFEKTNTNSTRIQSTPTHILPSIIFSNFNVNPYDDEKQPSQKRIKLGIDIDASKFQFNTNIPSILAEKITKNFKNPSPDDKRKIVESLSDKVSQINIEKQSLDQDSEKEQKKKTLNATKPKNKIDIDQELQRKSEKPLLSSIVIGHVDSGKSTTIGRLLYDLGIVDSRTLHKLTRDAELAGKGSFSLAWVMDQTPEERSRGVTIDIVQTQFETSNMRFAIIDSPGHRDYVPQMINGVTQADIAVVIIDATSDLILNSSNEINTNSSISEIAKGQTFEQLTIAANLGIKNVLAVINKMDVVNWDEDRFNLIKDSLNNYLIEKLNFKSENLSYLPASGFNGDNIINKSKNCSWYNGPTLFESLEVLNTKIHKSINHLTSNLKDPFALTITDITYGSVDTGSISSKKSDQITIHGRVNSGIIQPGESIKIWPSEETGQIDTVTTTISKVSNKDTSNINGKSNEKIAVTGEFVELKIRKVDLPDAICIGDLVTKITNDKEENYEVNCTNELTCELTMFGLTRPVLVGTPFVLFKGNVSYAARLLSIEWVETTIINEDGTTKRKKNKKRKHLTSGQRSKVIIETEKMIPLINLKNENYDKKDPHNCLEKLHRIVLRKEGMTVGAGIII